VLHLYYTSKTSKGNININRNTNKKYVSFFKFCYEYRISIVPIGGTIHSNTILYFILPLCYVHNIIIK